MLDECVSDVDVELESDGKFVVHQAGGDENALRAAEFQIAMANRAVAEGNVVTVGDDGLVSLIHGEWNEVVRLAIEGGGDSLGNNGNHPLHVGAGNVHLAGDGVADSVGRLRNGRVPDDFGWRARDGLSGLGHCGYSSARGRQE